MKLRILSGKNRDGAVGQPLRHPITILVTDNDGTPMKGTQVTIESKTPDTLEFTGGRGFADDRTDSDGKVEFNCTPLDEGEHKFEVQAGTESETGQVKAEDTGVTQVGGTTAVAAGDRVVLVNQQPRCCPAPASRGPRVIVVNNR